MRDALDIVATLLVELGYHARRHIGYYLAAVVIALAIQVIGLELGVSLWLSVPLSALLVTPLFIHKDS